MAIFEQRMCTCGYPAALGPCPIHTVGPLILLPAPDYKGRHRTEDVDDA